MAHQCILSSPWVSHLISEPQLAYLVNGYNGAPHGLLGGLHELMRVQSQVCGWCGVNDGHVG